MLISLAPQASAGQADYVRTYIKTALTSEDGLSAPDKSLSEGQYETLISLFQAYQLDGSDGAKKAWESIKKFRPALAELDPEAPIATYKPDDDMIATELAKELRTEVAYFHSAWKVYESGVWREQQVYEFRRHIRRELRHWRGRGVTVSQQRIKSLASMLEDDLFLTDRFIMERQKAQTRYINLRNGLFNLDTMQMEDHRSDLYFTTQLDFDYEPHAKVEHFRRYLNTSLVLPGSMKTDWDLCELVLEALAYSMTARTDMKSSFWLVGEKDSGKSTFITLIRNLMGELHATIDLNQMENNKFLLSGIIGKRVVSFTEASASTMLPDHIYKSLVGGSDEVYADVKNKPGIWFKPEAKVWWGMNEMPRINDRSGATTRRIVIIPFNRTVPEKDRISDLDGRLMSERSGIFNLVMDHLTEFKARGSFRPCAQSEARRQEYISENDTESTYIEERAEKRADFSIASGVLYADYKYWCEQLGFKAKNYNQIAKEWRRLGFEQQRSNGSHWKGLKLRG